MLTILPVGAGAHHVHHRPEALLQPFYQLGKVAPCDIRPRQQLLLPLPELLLFAVAEAVRFVEVLVLEELLLELQFQLAVQPLQAALGLALQHGHSTTC